MSRWTPDYHFQSTTSLDTPEPRIHEYGEEGNIHKRVALEFGNVEEGFAEADEIFEDTFLTKGARTFPLSSTLHWP